VTRFTSAIGDKTPENTGEFFKVCGARPFFRGFSRRGSRTHPAQPALRDERTAPYGWSMSEAKKLQ
jgi:hypothetical protein